MAITHRSTRASVERKLATNPRFAANVDKIVHYKMAHKAPCPHAHSGAPPDAFTIECYHHTRITRDFGGPAGAEYAFALGCREEVTVHEFAGCVLTTRERNGYHDSDFYAIVWDEHLQQLREIVYASTRFGCPGCGAKIDATDEVKEKAREWLATWAGEKWDLENAAQSKRVEIGRDIEVVRGRKIPIGTRGRIFWKGATRWGERVGIEQIDGERVFTAIGNVEIAEPKQHMKGAGERADFIERARASGRWHIPFAGGRGYIVL